MKSLVYATSQLPTTTATVNPSETIMTPLQWFNAHYTNQEGIEELKEDPTMKGIIYELAFSSLLSVPYYSNKEYGIADDDASMYYSLIDNLLIDDNVATIQGCSDFVRVWEINTLPKLLEDRELLEDNVRYVLTMLLSWKQQGVYLPKFILGLMRKAIDSWKDRKPIEGGFSRVRILEIYNELDTWYNCN